MADGWGERPREPSVEMIWFGGASVLASRFVEPIFPFTPARQ